MTNKWWDIRTLNSDGTSNKLSVHCSSHFKGLYDTKKIPHLILKMADNHLRNLHCHHIRLHEGNNYPYFDYDIKNQRSDCIKAEANVRKARVERQLTEINYDTKSIRDAGNQA